MARPLSVLLLEDSEDDALLLIQHLRRHGFDPSYRRVCTRQDMEAALAEQPWDVVLSDFAMPGFDGLSALAALKSSDLDIPFMLVSGQVGEDIAVAAMTAGAADFFLKNNLSRLGPAVERELREAQERRGRRAAENALRQSEERFRQMAENVDLAFWLTDAASGEILYISPSSDRIFRSSSDTAQKEPRHWRKLIHPEDIPRVLAASQGKQLKGSFDETYRLAFPDGSVRWIREKAFPIHTATGQVYRIVGTAEDVTDRMRLEEQLRHAQRLEAMGRLAGGVAHDFNNLLSIIHGFASLSQSDKSASRETREAIREILLASERGSDLTRQLLAVSRKQSLQRRNLHLNEIVVEIGKLLRRTLGKDIKLDLRCADDLSSVEGDPGMISQVLLNLGVNARDAMPEGGHLIVSTRNVVLNESDPQHPERRAGKFVCISVEDTGCGVAPENLHRIFEPFFTTKDPGKGTGLGLAIVHSIAQQHDGWIEVESQLEKGTRFALYLPQVEESQPSTPAAGQEFRGNETILLVEDDEAVRDLTRTSLESFGYRVLEAADGATAFERWKQERENIELLLTDVIMPGGITGLELAERIREQTPSLPVVFTSGYAADILGNAFFEVTLLKKPYTPLQLAKTVRDCLDGHGQTLLTSEEPSAPASEVPDTITPQTISHLLPKLRVLVVEDDRVNQLIARGVLKWYDYSVDFASNGREAVAAVKADDYDLVLMDIHMPELNGVESARQIRAELPPEKQPWISALTSDGSPRTRAQAMEAGMNDFHVGKPLRFETMRRLLYRLAQARAVGNH